MDPLTHTLLGAGLANAFFKEKAGRAAVPVLVLASNLPDLDGIVHLTGDPYAVLMRRTFGHSLFLLPFWSLALAWILGRRYREVPLRTLYGMTLAGVAGHLLFDLINSFGVVLFWPFSDARPELAWVFIIDFALTGLLALPLVVGLLPRFRPRRRTMTRAALVGVALYLAVCAGARWRAVHLLEAAVAEASTAAKMEVPGAASRGSSGALSGGAEFTYLFPEPLGPHRWRGVARYPGRYDLYLIHPWTGAIESRGSVRNDLDDPGVAAVRQTSDGRRLDHFFKAPVWQVESGEVAAWDLRFKPLVVERQAVFRYTFEPAPGHP